MSLFYMGRHEAEPTNKGRRRAGTILPLALAFMLLAGSVALADVVTDKWDYDYGETVQITGDGMTPGEEAVVDVLLPDGSLVQTHVVVANDQGEFADSFYLADGMPSGVYDVIATGLSSGFVFRTQFDPNYGVFDATAVVAPTTVSPGQVFTVTGRFRGDTNGGSPKTFDVTLSFGGGFTVAAPVTQSVTVANANTLVTRNWTVTAPLLGSGTGTMSLDNSGTANDKVETFSVAVAVPDTTPPVITPNLSGTQGDNGWYTSDVTVSWSVTDPESAISSSSGCGSTTIDSDTAGQTLTCSATSSGGTNSQSVTIKRDATAPTISGSASPAPNGNGWNNSDVTVSFSCADAMSGVASCGPNVTLSTDGAGQWATGAAADEAGNTASTTVGGIDIDKTAPSLSPTVSPNPVLLGGSATASPNASDLLSGLYSASCNSVNTSSVGTHTVSCTATDNADNSATASVTYSVIYDFSGFFRPVDNLPTLNVVKAGSAIPVKFGLSGDKGLGVIAAGYPKSVGIACPTGGTVDSIEETVTAGNSSLSYDAIADQYNYVWKTNKLWAGTCRQLTVRLIDDTDHLAIFSFK